MADFKVLVERQQHDCEVKMATWRHLLYSDQNDGLDKFWELGKMHQLQTKFKKSRMFTVIYIESLGVRHVKLYLHQCLYMKGGIKAYGEDGASVCLGGGGAGERKISTIVSFKLTIMTVHHSHSDVTT